MRGLQFFYSFRVRLMLVLAALLVTTLGVQYFLNLRAAMHSAQIVAEQEQALAAGVELGVRSISSTDRLMELLEQGGYPILRANARRVRNILVIDEKWNVYDSLAEAYGKSGDTKSALKFYQKALSITKDDQQKKRISDELKKLGA